DGILADKRDLLSSAMEIPSDVDGIIKRMEEKLREVHRRLGGDRRREFHGWIADAAIAVRMSRKATSVRYGLKLKYGALATFLLTSGGASILYLTFPKPRTRTRESPARQRLETN
ncbi:MAG: hypothetical protein QI199_02110, partial [Candidatus Korarchaeota archaeon]|nr:hypothetical protein [Candidatus Korarchaeota archaeon]